jgi:hypothetical protein
MQTDKTVADAVKPSSEKLHSVTRRSTALRETGALYPAER